MVIRRFTVGHSALRNRQLSNVDRPFDHMKANVGNVMLSLLPVITTRLAERDSLRVLACCASARARCFVLWFGPERSFVNRTSRSNNDGQLCPPAIRSS